MRHDLAIRLFEAWGVSPPTPPVLDEIEETLANATTRFVPPSLRGRFCEHLAAIVHPPEGDHLAELRSVAIDDIALALAASLGQQEAVHEIERMVIEPLPRTLGHLHLTSEQIDELRQDLREKLLVGATRGEDPQPKLLDYRGRGPLGAWVRVVATRAAYDQFRTARREEAPLDDDLLEELIDTSDLPDVARVREAYGNELRAAFRVAARRLSTAERSVLRSHTIDNLTIDQIGALYQIHRATAARWINQARDALLRALRDELRQRLGQSREDVLTSVIALVGSRLDLSVARALASEAEPPTDP